MDVPGQLPADAWMRGQRDPVGRGWAQAIRHGPMTIEQVLARGWSAMLDEDDAERRARDPFAYIPAPRRRRSLLARLLRR
jgi:hypothetical protein